MYIKTISASYERKVNLGDFSSMTVGASTWADLDEDEHHADRDARDRDDEPQPVMEEELASQRPHGWLWTRASRMPLQSPVIPMGCACAIAGSEVTIRYPPTFRCRRPTMRWWGT